jgi:outer membrane protein OmpA-like peptidoglycan-associated protein
LSRSTVLLVGLASLLLLTWAAVASRHAPIEQDLAARVQAALAGHSLSGLSVAVAGRDVRVAGEIPRALVPDRVAGIVASVWGVRVVDVSGLRQRASLRSPDDPLYPHLAEWRIARVGGELSRPLEPEVCQRMLGRVAATGSVGFAPGRAAPALASYQLLNDLAAVAYQCPAAYLVIGAHTDSSDDPEADRRLTQARAEAIQRFFVVAGIEADRIRAVGHGASRPVASESSDEGRAANRRITFTIEPTG